MFFFFLFWNSHATLRQSLNFSLLCCHPSSDSTLDQSSSENLIRSMVGFVLRQRQQSPFSRTVTKLDQCTNGKCGGLQAACHVVVNVDKDYFMETN